MQESETKRAIVTWEEGWILTECNIFTETRLFKLIGKICKEGKTGQRPYWIKISINIRNNLMIPTLS